MEAEERRQKLIGYVSQYTELLTQVKGVQHFLPPIHSMSNRELLEWSVSLKKHLTKAYCSSISQYYRLAQMRGGAVNLVKLRDLKLAELKEVYDKLNGEQDNG